MPKKVKNVPLPERWGLDTKEPIHIIGKEEDEDEDEDEDEAKP